MLPYKEMVLKIEKNKNVALFQGFPNLTRIISIAFLLSEKNANIHRNLAVSL